MTLAADTFTRPRRTLSQKAQRALPIPVLIYALCVLIPIGFQAGPLAMTTLRLFLMIMVLPIFFRLISGAYGKLIATDFLFIGYVLWMAIALAVNNPSQVIQQTGSVGVEFIGGYLMGRAYIRSRESFIALSKLLVVLVLLTTLPAIYETLTGRPIIVEFLRKLPGLNSVAVVTIEGRMGLERVQATFAHPIHYGLFCSIAFSMCFVALDGVYSLPRRLITSAIIMVSGFLALSSGALLAIILQIFLIAWSLAFAKVQARWWILLGLFVLAYITVDLLSNRTPIRVFMSYATFSAHNAYWRGIIFEWGLKNVFGDATFDIPASPLFGIGLNDWVRPHYMYSGSMDNFWLVTIVRFGIPAFLLLTIGYLLVLGRVMARDFSASVQLLNIRRAWVFTFIGLTFTLVTVHVWTNIYSMVFFMFGAGVWLIFEPGHDPESEDTPPAPERRHVYSRFPTKAAPATTRHSRYS